MLMGTQSLPVFGCTQNGDFKICHAHILGLLGRDSLIGTPRLATQYFQISLQELGPFFFRCSHIAIVVPFRCQGAALHTIRDGGSVPRLT